MKKIAIFVSIILVFSLLAGFSIPKVSAATGYYTKITTPGYYTWLPVRGSYYVVKTQGAYTTVIDHSNLKEAIKQIWHPATYKLVWFNSLKQIWHRAITRQVWISTKPGAPSYSYQVWLATGRLIPAPTP